eukprot:12911887-Prorocentrum_lima.AAC.1
MAALSLRSRWRKSTTWETSSTGQSRRAVVASGKKRRMKLPMLAEGGVAGLNCRTRKRVGPTR